MTSTLYVSNPTWTVNTPAGGPWNLAQSFQVSDRGSVDQLGFYRITLGMPTPNALVLWDVSLGTEIARVTSLNDSGAVGWQWTDLPSPVNLADHTSYCVGAHIAAGSSVAVFSLGTLPTPGAYFGFSPPYRRFLSNASVAFPTGSDNSLVYGFDVRFTPGGVQPPSLSDISQTVDDKLFAWLTSTNDNTHQTELPWQTYGEAQSASAGAATAATAAASAQTAAEGNAGSISNVSTQLDGVSGDVGTLLGRLSADLATLLNDSSQAIADWLNGAAADPTQWWTGFLDSFKRATGGSGFGGPDPLQGWTLQDTLEFTDEAAWAQEADLYRVNLDSTGSLAPADPVAGVPVTYRLGWWSVLNGSFFRQRAYLDGPNADLVGPNGRMPGLVIFLNHGGHGTIEAWTKD